MNELCAIINKCFSNGIFPDCLKLATITPIFKKGDRSDFRNYRPISVLPLLSKIFERLLYNRLLDYCTSNSILTPFQFGFRPKLTTQDATLNLTEYLYEALNNKEIAVSVFIDYSKAYDTVNHGILLKKMEKYGINGIALDLIKNYLTNRKQCVRIKSEISSYNNISIGIPQGSVLGSIFFLLYINDFPNIDQNFKPTMFADDSTISVRDKSEYNLFSRVNTVLSNFFSWTVCNRLSLNIEKTSYMITTNRLNVNIPPLEINGISLKFVKCTKFLGIGLDSDLKFKTHITHVYSKISKSIGVLNRLKKFVPINIMCKLYYSNISIPLILQPSMG